MNPGIAMKNAEAQEIVATRAKTNRGMVSLGNSPFRTIKGTAHRSSMMKKGKIDSGATIPPDKVVSKGNEVIGRQIKAMAQRTSQMRLTILLDEIDCSITG